MIWRCYKCWRGCGCRSHGEARCQHDTQKSVEHRDDDVCASVRFLSDTSLLVVTGRGSRYKCDIDRFVNRLCGIRARYECIDRTLVIKSLPSPHTIFSGGTLHGSSCSFSSFKHGRIFAINDRYRAECPRVLTSQIIALDWSLQTIEIPHWMEPFSYCMNRYSFPWHASTDAKENHARRRVQRGCRPLNFGASSSTVWPSLCFPHERRPSWQLTPRFTSTSPMFLIRLNQSV